MPGTPPTTPNFGLPRYSQADNADFSDQVNPIVDLLDAKAAQNTDARLTDQRTPLDGSVTAAKLAAGSVGSAALAAGAVTASKLANDAVATVAIADGAVTDAKLAANTITAASLSAGAVNTSALADGAVTSSKLTAALQPAVNLPGDLIVSAASSRAGALLCDGSAVSRTTYAALFAAVGATYGAGDGSTTFNVPDFRQRVIIGAGSAGGDASRPTARQRGQVGGAETYVLKAAEMPAHTHAVPPLNLGDDTTANIYTYTATAPAGGSGRWQLAPWISGFPVLRADGGTTGSAGGGGAHTNVQPFAVANVFIKT
jgi:microcystin-dependent protein